MCRGGPVRPHLAADSRSRKCAAVCRRESRSACPPASAEARCASPASSCAGTIDGSAFNAATESSSA